MLNLPTIQSIVLFVRFFGQAKLDIIFCYYYFLVGLVWISIYHSSIYQDKWTSACVVRNGHDTVTYTA